MTEQEREEPDLAYRMAVMIKALVAARMTPGMSPVSSTPPTADFTITDKDGTFRVTVQKLPTRQ